MQFPVFQLFPATEPLPLVAGQTSDLFEFPVFAQAPQNFIRFIALWTDNTAPGSPAPTIQLKSGGGLIKSVPADVGDVELPNGAGIASCQSQPADTYLLTLSEMSDDSGPWSLRIKNNADKTLRFAWVSAPEEQNTLRPWLAVGDGVRDAAGTSLLSLTVRSTDQFVPVHNWGTTSATLGDQVDMPIGGQDSPVVLAGRPDSIEPHGVDHISLRCEQLAPHELEHVFESNDIDPAHTTVRLTILPAQ